MRGPRVVGSVLVLLAQMASSVHADDACGVEGVERQATADARAGIAKVEKSGNQVELFQAYQAAVGAECVSSDFIAKARANMTRLGRDLAKVAETKGLLYSSEPVRADGRTSAFRYFEAIGDYPEGNRVMLKAVQAKSGDLSLFKAAWTVDDPRLGPADPKTGSRQPYVSPSAYRQELQKVASATADRLMKAEKKDAPGLSGSMAEAGLATMKSLAKLRTAAEWMKFLPAGDKPVRDLAEQRGDAIMKRSDPTFTQKMAREYYEFAGSARSMERLAQIDKKHGESQQALEKASEAVKGAFMQQSEADQNKFDKKKADLEKELGF